jgi:hypothetical protein
MKSDLENLNSLVTLLVTYFKQWPSELTSDVLLEMIAKAAHHPTVKDWDPIKWENATDTLLEVMRLHQNLKCKIKEFRPDVMNEFELHAIT